MRFLKTMKQGLQGKIDEFLAEHPTAKIIKRHEYNGSTEHTQVDWCRFLDKDGKKTDFYLFDSIKTINDECGCFDKTNYICVFEEADFEKIKELAKQEGCKVNSDLLFDVYNHILLKCRLGDPPRTTSADICDLCVKYDRAEEIVRKIRSINKVK